MIGSWKECCNFDQKLYFHVSTDKPPIEELQQFLEFQLPRQWAPVFSDLPLGPQRKKQSKTYLQFSFMGPKLFVNTSPVRHSLRHLLSHISLYNDLPNSLGIN